jgi:hypothetical protein
MVEESDRLEEGGHPNENDKEPEIDESMVQKNFTESKIGFLAGSLKTRSSN